MSQEDIIFVFCLVLVAVASFMVRHLYKKYSTEAMIVLILAAAGGVGLFLVREKSAELALVKQAKLPNGSRWEVLASANTNAGVVAIIKNEKTGKVAAVQLADKKPPNHFQVSQRGWWGWPTTHLIAIHEGEK